MKNYDQDYIPGHWNSEKPGLQGVEPQKPKKSVSIGFLLSAMCIVAVLTMLFTYTLTSASKRSYYSKKLARQQETIDALREDKLYSDFDIEKLQLLAGIFDAYSYYAGDKTEEEMLNAVLKAYAAATGDLYAEYYTGEEYQAIIDENNGDYQGIGVSVIQTTATVEGYEYQVFQIIAIYEGAPAESSGLRVGDLLYCIKVDGTYQTVAALGGYTKAINYIRGEKGTNAEFAVLRPNGDSYENLEFSVTRDEFETQSVTWYFSEENPKVGVVHIFSFDLTTPSQFKAAVEHLKADGAEHFVFDVRNNPGGDLQSIKAVLTYFLQDGDLILSAIDRNGNVAASYYAEAMKLAGDYASCNVDKKEIGMYADLDMTVLCNENTASAAEVFTATLRDYGLATIVGDTTFGKGIMQSTLPLSYFGKQYTGYVKMTTYAYVTKCGVTYHDIGITPDVQVSLSEEAKTYNVYVLPQSLDDQLKAAVAQFQR
ncbi:MAG: hypothetical protein IJD75_00135 [Clostridia bacterium]|nr:hypothetical protein [Clostridia bacterium]